MGKLLTILLSAFVGGFVGFALTNMKAEFANKLDLLEPDIDGDDRYNFALTSSIKLDFMPENSQEISLFEQKKLTTIKPEHIQSICLETRPYDGDLSGEYELAISLTFTPEYKNTLYQTLQIAETSYLKLKFNDRTVIEGVLLAGQAENYRAFMNNYPNEYDLRFAAWHGNQAGLLEFVHALSPTKMPYGCDDNFNVEHINKDGQTVVKKLW